MIKLDRSFKDFFINLLIGKRFRKPNNYDANNIANNIADHIIKMPRVKINTKIRNIRKSLKSFYYLKLKNGDTLKKKLDITIWNWQKVIFVFLNGEILSGYNIFDFKGAVVICIGYTNGMIGYLPTKEDIIKGGYEVDKSRINFQIKDKISKENERKIKDKIDALISESFLP